MNNLAEIMLNFVLYGKDPADTCISRIFNYCRKLPRLDNLVVYEKTEKIKRQYIILVRNAVQTVSKDFLLVALVITHEQLMHAYRFDEKVCNKIGFWFSEVLDYVNTI